MKKRISQSVVFILHLLSLTFRFDPMISPRYYSFFAPISTEKQVYFRKLALNHRDDW